MTEPLHESALEKLRIYGADSIAVTMRRDEATALVEHVAGIQAKADSAAGLIVEVMERLSERIEARIHAYCTERDWQKLREWEMAALAVEECGVELTNLAGALRP